MNTDYRILPVEKPTDEMWEVIGHGIGQYNQQHGGPQGFQHLCFALYTPDGKVAGGLIGEIYWGWFYINLLFVIEELRGQGYGHQLLTQAEEEARKRARPTPFSTRSASRPRNFTSSTATGSLANSKISRPVIRAII